MTLPGPAGGPTTKQVGYFACDHRRFAEWLAPGLGRDWHVAAQPWQSLDDAMRDLAPAPVKSRYGLLDVAGWTVLMNNTPLGTDVGLLHRHAARELRCRAVRAVCVDDDQPGYPARMLSVYGPDGDPTDAFVERSIAAANDGGRWVFQTHGRPYPFEDLTAYQRRRKTDRFTSTMLYDYLRALDVPIDTEPDWATAVLVQRT